MLSVLLMYTICQLLKTYMKTYSILIQQCFILLFIICLYISFNPLKGAHRST